MTDDPTVTGDAGVPGPGIDVPIFVAHLGEWLDAALRDLAARPRILVALDFDGVLAPLVRDPATSRIVPASVAALAELSELPGVTLALVSGREASGLVSLAEVPEHTHVVGSHGVQRGRVVRSPDGGLALDAEPVALTTEQADLRARVLRDAEELVAQTPEAWVEGKPAAVVVHTRRCTPADGERLRRAVLEGPGALAGLRVQEGKEVIEMAVLHHTKGDAVTDLRAVTGADAVLYAGDDRTDEDAFAVLEPQDVGIKVGDGPTAASHRVADPDELSAVLLRLVELRSPVPADEVG
ncbi:trehalose-phosphatase [Georgenia faecalis]|uniref:Trehalose 6-phosphate phosphatase n=1 Tax=Georgenia faecalis TaxID=2483799 RepID=A0ABV9D6C5_9MICO|nr:trehalose-phosphatase [Georgenia faecalis]